MFIEYVTLSINPFEGMRRNEIPYIQKSAFKKMIKCWANTAKHREKRQQDSPEPQGEPL